MSIEPHITITVENLSLTIYKREEEVELMAISERFRSPSVKAFNLNTALRLLKGWIVLNCSAKQEEEFTILEGTLFDELAGAIMQDSLTFMKYRENYSLTISPESDNEWICKRESTGELLRFREGDYGFVRYPFFKKGE